LYLDQRRVRLVGLEGPALRVRLRGRGDGVAFYPLRMLARVVVSGRVPWETDALLACLRYGVPVAFRKRDGQLIGHCLSQLSSSVSLEQLIFHCAESEAGTAVYLHWLAQGERRILIRLGRALKVRFPSLAGREVEPSVLAYLDGVVPVPAAVFERRLLGVLESHLVEILYGFGFSDNIQLPLSNRINLRRDLVRLMLWELRLLLVVRGVEIGERGEDYGAVRFYQSVANQVEQRVRLQLQHLWRNLKQLEAD